jgi:hypothetical protein
MNAKMILLGVALGSIQLSAGAGADSQMTEAQWRETMDGMAAGKDLMYLGRSGVKAQEEALARNCGHTVPLKIDWTGFHYADWSTQPVAYRPSVVDWCGYETLVAMTDLCRNSDYEAKKPALAAIKLITCHYKPCAKLLRSTPPNITLDKGSGPLPQSDKPPGREFSLSKDGTTIAVSFCEKSDAGEQSSESRDAGYTAMGFLKKQLGLH